jgi:hypothetical protein
MRATRPAHLILLDLICHIIDLSMEDWSSFPNFTRMGALDLKLLPTVTEFRLFRICDSRLSRFFFLVSFQPTMWTFDKQVI